MSLGGGGRGGVFFHQLIVKESSLLLSAISSYEHGRIYLQLCIWDV